MALCSNLVVVAVAVVAVIVVVIVVVVVSLIQLQIQHEMPNALFRRLVGLTPGKEQSRVQRKK